MSQVHITASQVPLYSLPLPMYSAMHLGVLEAKDGSVFDMFLGLDREVVEQLRQKSLDITDVDLQKNTSDYERFGNGSYEEWYSKQRTPFVLVHKGTRSLAALVWFGPKPLGRKSLKYLSGEERAQELSQQEDVWHTLVYRSYIPYRGVGIMKSFVQFTIDVYKKQYPNAKLWVGGRADNMASARLAEVLGFKRRGDLFDAEKNWAAMTLE